MLAAAALAPTLMQTDAINTEGFDLTYRREDQYASIFDNAPKVPLPTGTARSANEGGAEAAAVVNGAPRRQTATHSSLCVV